MAAEINLVQGSPEWREWRRHKRMASETPAIMGVSPYMSAADIRAIKLGGNGPSVSVAMQYGHDQEPLARAAYEALLEPMRPAVMVDGDYGASLDGINIGGDTILEVKSPFVSPRFSDRWVMATRGEATEGDYAQIQHQMMVSGAEIAHLWIWDGQEGKLVVILPNPDYWGEIKTSWDKFWSTLAAREDAEWVDVAGRYKMALRAASDAEEALAVARRELEALVVGDYARGEGVEVKRVTRRGAVDWMAVQREHLGGINVDAYRKPSISFFDVRTAKDGQ